MEGAGQPGSQNLQEGVGEQKIIHHWHHWIPVVILCPHQVSLVCGGNSEERQYLVADKMLDGAHRPSTMCSTSDLIPPLSVIKAWNTRPL